MQEELLDLGRTFHYVIFHKEFSCSRDFLRLCHRIIFLKNGEEIRFTEEGNENKSADIELVTTVVEEITNLLNDPSYSEKTPHDDEENTLEIPSGNDTNDTESDKEDNEDTSLKLKPQKPEETSSSTTTKIPSLDKNDFKSKIEDLASHEIVSSYFESLYGKDSQMIRFIRFFDQNTVLSFLGKLTDQLNETGIKFRDCKGTWNVIIGRKDTRIFLSHKRKEQGFLFQKGRMVNVFNFEWKVEAIFAKDMTHIEEISASVLDIDWENKDESFSSQSKAEELENKFRVIFGSHPSLADLTYETLNIPPKKKKENLELEEFKRSSMSRGKMRRLKALSKRIERRQLKDLGGDENKKGGKKCCVIM